MAGNERRSATCKGEKAGMSDKEAQVIPDWRQSEQNRTVLHLVVRVITIVFVAATLMLSRSSGGRRWPASASLKQTFPQRAGALTVQGPVTYRDTDRGFLRRRIPSTTLDTPNVPRDTSNNRGELSELARGGSQFVDPETAIRSFTPETSSVPITRTKVITYSVQQGDTLWDIAQKFHITQDTLWTNNDLHNPNMLSVGEELVIPPIDGLIYTVQPGDTLGELARRYRTDVKEIVNYAPNDLREEQLLTVGQTVIIPGGIKPIPSRGTFSLTRAPADALKGTGSFIMPVSGRLTQGFRSGHPAIDVAAPKGTPVYAADAGYVSFAGWHPWGYGYVVEIDHGNGFRTLYAHLYWYEPDTGDSVQRGELIGGAGNTYGRGGYASGSHLHFEVIQDDVKRDPCSFVACP